jgi:Leucine-rich repeat (LRR) protein
MDKEFYKKIKALIASNDDSNVYLGIELMKSLKGPLLMPFMQKLRRKDVFLMKTIDYGFVDGLRKLDVKTLSVSGDYHKYEREAEPLNAAIGVLVQLIELSLTGLKITRLPKEIANLKKLKTLYLSHNLFTFLPKTIADLERLDSASFSNNPLSVLPETIGDLKRLRYLNLSSTALKELPESIGALNLRHLDLANCPDLKELPKSLFSPWKTPTINLQNSGLLALPEQLSLSSEKERYLELNIENTKVSSLSSILEMDVSKFKGAININAYGTNIPLEELKLIKKKSTRNCHIDVNYG